MEDFWVRHAEHQDAPSINAMLARTYSTIPVCTTEMIAAQIANFSQGVFVALASGKVVGYAASIRLPEEVVLDPLSSWMELTGFGTGSTQYDEGDVLYGFEMAVDPSYQARGIAKKLLQTRMQCSIMLGLKSCYMASRMPGLSSYLSQFPDCTAEEYLHRVIAGSITDHTVLLGLSLGFVPIRLLSNYSVVDTDSLGYAILKCWNNPLGGLT